MKTEDLTAFLVVDRARGSWRLAEPPQGTPGTRGSRNRSRVSEATPRDYRKVCVGFRMCPAEIPRRSAEIPRRSAEIPRWSAEIPRRSAEIPRRSAGIPRRSAGVPRRSAEMPLARTGILGWAVCHPSFFGSCFLFAHVSLILSVVICHICSRTILHHRITDL